MEFSLIDFYLKAENCEKFQKKWQLPNTILIHFDLKSPQKMLINLNKWCILDKNQFN